MQPDPAEEVAFVEQLREIAKGFSNVVLVRKYGWFVGNWCKDQDVLTKVHTRYKSPGLPASFLPLRVCGQKKKRLDYIVEIYLY